MRLNDFDQAYQGDIWLMKLPDSYEVNTENEVKPLNGKLVLQEGEMTGHHHHIDVLDRPSPVTSGNWWDEFEDESLRDIFGKKRPAFSAKMYNGTSIASRLVDEQILLRPDLVVGLLVVEGGPAKVQHQEHSFIGLMPGKYVVGRQIESVAGEERRVAD